MNQLDLQLVAFKEFGRVAETPVTIIKRDSDPRFRPSFLKSLMMNS